jgi:hypothetical protein
MKLREDSRRILVVCVRAHQLRLYERCVNIKCKTLGYLVDMMLASKPCFFSPP